MVSQILKYRIDRKHLLGDFFSLSLIDEIPSTHLSFLFLMVAINNTRNKYNALHSSNDKRVKPMRYVWRLQECQVVFLFRC
jgi:hypothetical protein